MEAENGHGTAGLKNARWIDLGSACLRKFWANRLGCSENRLHDAVTMVGPVVDDVKSFLAQPCGLR